jgi:hypothetical protein
MWVAWSLAFGARPAAGYPVGLPVALDQLEKTADLVCKATVAEDRVVPDSSFDKVPGFEVRETELRLVSIIKGHSDAKLVRFRHYALDASGAAMYAPQSYQLAVGRSYIVFASRVRDDLYRPLSNSHTMKEDQGVILAADDKPHRGKTIGQAVWLELRGLLAGGSDADVVYAIAQLDQMSGGRRLELKDFDRRLALDAIRPLIGAKSNAIATAAIEVFGADSPYFDERLAAYWLAGLGKGSLPGLEPLTPPSRPAADVARTELLAVANSTASADLRARAIRALGRSHAVPEAKIEAWGRDANVAVRQAAVLVSAELAPRKLIVRGVADAARQVRQSAALAIGFTQDAALLPMLDKLLRDPAANVREAAAMSVLSFAPDRARAVMLANLESDYQPLFVNALARGDPQPYLAMLAKVIEKRLRPSQWWGGFIPAGDSWEILFEYVKTRPAAELAAGTHDASLDALEHMEWYSSSEPRDLYALYVVRGLTARAKRFRAAMHKAVTYDIDYYFDMVDKHPSGYVP